MMAQRQETLIRSQCGHQTHLALENADGDSQQLIPHKGEQHSRIGSTNA